MEVASGREEVAGRENDSFDMEGNELNSLRWLGPGRRIEREVDASGGEGERARGAIGRGDEILEKVGSKAGVKRLTKRNLRSGPT